MGGKESVMKSTSKKFKALLGGGILLLVFILAAPVLAGSVTFQASRDAVILFADNQLADSNFGSRTLLDVGTHGATNGLRHSLIGFDLSSLAGQIGTVNSVTLRLHVLEDALFPSGSNTVELYRLADANAGWIEGEVTWNERQPGVASWAGSAGASTAGTDYVSTLLASKSFDTTTDGVFDLVISGADAGFVLDWVSGTNAGFLLKPTHTVQPSNNLILFHSREATDPTLRPELIVDFTPVTVILLAIDIKPGSFPNSINPRSRGVIPVAILSGIGFDASAQVDQTSVTFGRTGDEPSLASCHTEDVNADGLLDLVCHFHTQATGFQRGDTQGVLKAQTVAGQPLQALDSVKVVP